MIVTGDRGGPPQVQAVQNGDSSDEGSASFVDFAGFCFPAQQCRSAAAGRIRPAQQQVPAERRAALHLQPPDFAPQQDPAAAEDTNECCCEFAAILSATRGGSVPALRSAVAVVVSGTGIPIDATKYARTTPQTTSERQDSNENRTNKRRGFNKPGRWTSGGQANMTRPVLGWDHSTHGRSSTVQRRLLGIKMQLISESNFPKLARTFPSVGNLEWTDKPRHTLNDFFDGMVALNSKRSTDSDSPDAARAGS